MTATDAGVGSFLEGNLCQLLLSAPRERTAIIDGSSAVSYEELAARALGTAEAVTAAGAGPGDRIAIRGGHVVLNGKRQKEPFIEPCGGGEACDLPREIRIPADHYFMMGDNRGSSDDSRFWGPVPREWIIGEAFATYWPVNRIGLL